MWTRVSCWTIAVALLVGATAIADEPRILRRGAFGEPESLDPDRSGVVSELPIVLDLFEGLTTFDADGQVIPGQAESWQAS